MTIGLYFYIYFFIILYMKSLTEYINEKLKINKSSKKEPTDMVVVNSNDELKRLIRDRSRILNPPYHLDLRDVDVSAIEKFDFTFFGETTVKSIDITGWDTSNAVSFEGMFSFCPSVEEIIGIDEIETGNCTDMSSMFKQCHALKSLDVSTWDTRNVQYFAYMFKECKKLEYIEGIENFSMNSLKVHGNDYMFTMCISLKNLDLSSWELSPLSTNYMFYKCENLETLDLSGWCDKANLVDAEFMFDQCKSLKKIHGIENFNTNVLVNAKNMFAGCESLVADLSNWKLPNLSIKTKQFFGAKKIKKPKK